MENNLKKYQKVYDKYIALYNARLLRKKFIPIEKIAQDPKKYGYPNIQKRDSTARQSDFIHSTKKVNAAICANRAGKTEAGAIKFLRNVLKSKISGRAWVLSESFDLQKSGTQEKILYYLKPEFIKKINYEKANIIKSIDVININKKEITIEFKTYEQGPSKLQTAKLICAWLDEEPKEEIYDEVYTRTLDLKGQIILTFTPLKGLTWSYKRIYNSHSNFIEVFAWGMYSNPFIPMEEIDELLNTLSVKKANMRVYGKYQGSDLMVFYSFDKEKHLKDNCYDIMVNEGLVDVCIDWGVCVTCIQFWQEKKIIENNKTIEKYALINAVELENVGYSQVMKYILTSNYIIRDLYCDPAARSRNQATKSGISLLTIIKKEYNIDFKYILSLGIEESSEILNSYFENASGQVKIEIENKIVLNNRNDTPAMRIEGYVRDENTLLPIKDGINDHFCDTMRMYIANKSRRFKKWRQN